MRWDEREKKYLLLYPERGLLLNETASAILELCDGARTVAAIASELRVRHMASALGDVEREVLAFLERLRERGLLEVGS
jgi:pyrroloquinoline quinone biosynthesis protein D